MVDTVKFKVVPGAKQTDLADRMCEEVKAVIYGFSDRVPLALAVGVLEIAKREIMDNNGDQ